MTQYTPSLISPNCQSAYYDNLNFFTFNGAIYTCLVSFTTFTLGVFRSTDGVNFSQLDALNAPAVTFLAWCYDGAATVYVVVGVPGPRPNAVTLCTFNLATGLWSGQFAAAGAPSTGFICNIHARPNGTLLLIHVPNLGSATPENIFASSYDIGSGIWSAPFQIDGALAALPGYPGAALTIAGQTCSVMDSTGRVHFFWSSNNVFLPPPWIWQNRCFYQAVNADNSLGGFFDVPGQDQLVGGQQVLGHCTGTCFGTPAIAGDNIVLPVSVWNTAPPPGAYASVYVGTSLSAPVWSANLAVGIDTEALTTDLTLIPTECARLWCDGATIFAIETISDAAFNINRR